MDTLVSWISRTAVTVWDVVDVLVVALIIYESLKLIRGTRAMQMAFGSALLVGLYYVSVAAPLQTVNWLIRNMVGYVVFAAIVLFQSDIRRALARLGQSPFFRYLATPESADETIEELVVRVSGPLGLVSRQGARRRPWVLRVHPPFRSKEEAELRIDRARLLEVGLRSAAGRGGGTEFDQLRDYAVDDEFRRIDWAASARVDRPIVRTYRAERNQTVIVLLDNGRVMAGQVGRDKAAPDARFLALLPLIEKGARDDRPFVMKGVSWALRRIGRRNAALNKPCAALARQLASSEVPSVRWVGRDALRELTSAKVLALLARRG